MRLSSKHQPKTLSEIVGQPAIVRRLQRLVSNPSPCCILFEGRSGVGKSATLQALVNDLNVCKWSGLSEYSASDLTMETVRHLFGKTFRLRPMSGSPWHVLAIEELELLPSRNVSAALKDCLSEQHMPEHLIVSATTNDASGLDEALLQRFEIFPFACGPTFAGSCLDRLNEIWQREMGQDCPMSNVVADMGWTGKFYSMRRALNAMGTAAELQKMKTSATL